MKGDVVSKVIQCFTGDIWQIFVVLLRRTLSSKNVNIMCAVLNNAR